VGDSSKESERTIIEASALLVTLLFLILQIGESWKDSVWLAKISTVSFLFIASAIAAIVVMGGDPRSSFFKPLRYVELLLFGLGLALLADLFYQNAAELPYLAGFLQTVLMLLVVFVLILVFGVPRIARYIASRLPAKLFAHFCQTRFI